jgi:4a-hydroxytetrahydrobiopterin dehydratase
VAEELCNLSCEPCRKGAPRLSDEEIDALHKDVPTWGVVDFGDLPRLVKTFDFTDFAAALQFTDAVGGLAEEQGHHPAILTEWGKVTVSWWTHKIQGLHRNDFIMAARTDALYKD